MSSKKSKLYALCKESFEAKSIPIGVEENLHTQCGMMVEIVEENPDKTCTIKFRDYYSDKNLLWDTTLFVCQNNQLIRVTENVWPYLIAIVDPEERYRFMQRGNEVKKIVQLYEGDCVKVSGKPFNRRNSYDCIIRYVGCVPELGPGYYFAFELLNLDNGYSPQEEIQHFLNRYNFADDSKLALVLAANWIESCYQNKDSSSTSKFAPKIFFNNIFSSVKELTHTKKSSNKNRNSAEIDADNYPLLNGIQLSGSHDSLAKLSSVGERQIESSKMASSISSPNLSKQDSSSSTGSSARMNGIEQNYNSFHHHGSSDGSNSSTSTTHSRSHHGKKGKLANNTVNSNHPQIRPSTIMHYEDRDLIVIEENDIKESTSAASDVIIVDPPPVLTSPEVEQMDLKDILGSSWPKEAGPSANILNTDYNSINDRERNGISTMYTRNKSPNPISHFVTSKVVEKSTGGAKNGWNKNDRKMVDRSTMANFNENHVYGNTSLPQVIPTTESDFIQPSKFQNVPNSNIGIGSLVEVNPGTTELHLYGLIRWIGEFSISSTRSHLMVGVELEEDFDNDDALKTTDGTHNGIRFFKCSPHRGIFVYPNQVKKDRRFQEYDHSVASGSKSMKKSDAKMFGAMECPIIEGSVPPIKVLKPRDLEEMCGKFKGIQGHHNSCYLDATLFAMFTFTSVFDSLLFRPPDPEDNPHYEEVQRVLREEIVNPLRKNLFVRADRVMKLRQLLDKLSSVTGLMSEEKDPEEFLNSLLAQILRADPFLKLSSGLDTFYYQLFVEKDESLSLPSVQQLFEQSFLTSDIKLKEVPSCLIIQMPRFGKNFKMYPRISPSQVLDVTDIIEDSPRQCNVCGKLAEYECRECFGMMQNDGLEGTAFCKNCLDTAHSHNKRKNHKAKEISVPNDFKIMAEHCPVPRLFMELFAVVCIETSHYVAFVKAASGQDAPWCFFDSMADRNGEQNGYNIPEMVPVPDLPEWLSEEGARKLHDAAANDKMLPEHAKRLLCDAYMCMYQSTDVLMYR